MDESEEQCSARGLSSKCGGCQPGSSYGVDVEVMGVDIVIYQEQSVKKKNQDFRSSTGKLVEIGVLQHWCLKSKFSKSISHCSTGFSHKIRGTFPQARTEKASP